MAVDVLAAPRVAPWRNLVTDIPEGMKLREAIEHTDLAYEVGFSPLFMENGVQVPDKRATIRLDTKQYLGTVGDRYTIIQNKDAFAFLENIVDSGEVKPLGAGYFKQGARPWLQARLPEDVIIAGDKHVPFIFCATSHDGGLPLIISLSAIRVICENTYAMNVRSPRKFIVRHLASAQFRVAEARRVLELTYKYFEEFAEGMEALASEAITDEGFRDVVENLFRMPDPNHSTEQERENVAKKRAQLVRVYTDSPLVPRGTKYGAMQAVTEWADHIRNGMKGDPRQRAERKTEWVLLGDGVEFKDRALQFIEAAR